MSTLALPRRPVRATLAALLLLTAGLKSSVGADLLADGFRAPPPSARPHTWWHWMNGNISRAGITADLEAMKRFGVGGVQIFNVLEGIPAGPVDFMSPQWRELFAFAVAEADRLRLEVCVHNCAGWTSSGGPWVTPEGSMQQITTSEVRVHGPVHFDDRLPLPPSKLDHYRDIAVHAFRTPPAERVRFRDLHPVVTVNTPGDGAAAVDGDEGTAVTFPAPRPGQSRHVTVAFTQPFQARTVRVELARGLNSCAGTLQVSDDGTTYREVHAFKAGWRNAYRLMFALPAPVAARFWRVQFESTGGMSTVGLQELDITPVVFGENFEGRIGLSGAQVHGLPIDTVPAADIVPMAGIVDLTARMSADGRLAWDVPEGDWTILRTGHTPTGRTNRPAPPSGTGPECDKLSREGFDAHWDGFMGKVIADVGPLAGRTLKHVLIDSWEVAGQNWTPQFADEYARRRGYSPLPFLPALTGRTLDSPEMTARFLWDLRRTIADLVAENYFGRCAELAHRHGMLASVEPYGGPFESLQSASTADIVMGEFWAGGAIGHPMRNLKLAASAAHVHGQPVVGAEAFTADARSGRWQQDPQSLKAAGDAAFCSGVNRQILHCYAHQPWPDRAPGMTMGPWGTNFARTNTWFEPAQVWIDYLARCQFLLQQGRFVADVAYFTGENAPVELRTGEPAMPPGYDFDGVSADVLRTARMVDRRLVLASGMSYAVLVLPPGDANVRPAALREIRRLVAEGLTVVGPRPVCSPSLQDFPRCDEEIRSLAAELWGDCDGRTVREHAFGQGRIIWGRELGDVLASLGLKPDVTRAADPAAPLPMIHRTTENAEIYFVTNPRTEPVAADYTFRVAGRQPELWHADAGATEPAPVWRQEDGRTTVRLELEPAGSVFVVFRRPAPSDPLSLLAHTGAVPPTLSVGEAGATLTAWAPGEYTLTRASGRAERIPVSAVPAPIGLDAPWRVTFAPGRGAPPEVMLSRLASWSEHPETGVKYFSGTATYSQEFEVPADRLGVGYMARLDLGRVKNLAEVRLNGRDLGVWWKAPFRADVTAALRPGRNRIEIKVTNLWVNRLIGDEQLPADCEWNPNGSLKAWPQWLLDGQPSPTGRVTFTTWRHWTKDSPLPESGLLGPVRIEFGTHHNLRISD